MAFTVNDYQDLVQLLRQRPEWQVELRHLLLDDDFLALPRIVAELAEAQRRTEARVEELAEAQRRTEARVEELAEAQRRTEVRVIENTNQISELAEVQRQSLERLDRLERNQETILKDLAWLKGDSIERKYAERAHSYFGRWMRRIKVVLPNGLDAETENRLTKALTDDEYDQLLELDVLIRGQLHRPTALAGQEIWLALEASVIMDREDVRRARERAALLRKAGFRALPVVAGKGLTEGAGESLQYPPIVLLLNGHATGWDEAMAVLQNENV
ncbi:MAG: hypothetical protein HY741_02185 [Chloroflexi bacterium]|nr:hypothetical protein [Chloroflexota bacterium]